MKEKQFSWHTSHTKHSLVGGRGGGGGMLEDDEGIKQTRERGGATPSVLLCELPTEGKR